MWRTHQAQCLALCNEVLQGRSTRHIIASVTPGGGKSALPVILASRLMPMVADRICWLVPRSALQGQAQEAFRSPFFRSMLGHRLHLGTEPGEGSGFATTYQALLANRQRYRKAFEQHRYILVLDEPHHAPEEGDWAIALEPLVNRCSMLVQMSGTFQRHDRKPVSFLPYLDRGGELVLDFDHAQDRGAATLAYSRVQALEEKAVIPLEVRWFDLSVSWEQDGEQTDLFSLATVDDKAEAKEGLYVALNSKAATSILMACYRDWLEYRGLNPRSKLLVVAASTDAAKEFLDTLKKSGAQRVGMATSKETGKAHRNIEQFKSHGDKRLDILITVAMAYEGLDVPSCTHIAALTNIRSTPWIEQMVTRATRVDQGEGALPYDRQTAYLYCPDDILMRECIEAIVEQQEQVAYAPDTREPGTPSEEEKEKPPERVILESTATLSGLSDLDGEELTAEEIQQLPALARVTGTSETILRSMRISHLRNQFRVNQGAIAAVQCSQPGLNLVATIDLNPTGTNPTGTKTIAELRRTATSLANRLDRQKGWAPGTANSLVKGQFRKSRTRMTGEELDRVCGWLEKQLQVVNSSF